MVKLGKYKNSLKLSRLFLAAISLFSAKGARNAKDSNFKKYRLALGDGNEGSFMS